MQVVENILEKDSSAIIIIHGDHGTAWDVNWFEPTKEDVYQRLRNLDAIYFPDKEKRGLLLDDRTLVNTFRTVFNAYFGSDYEILENNYRLWEEKFKSIFPLSLLHLLRFETFNPEIYDYYDGKIMISKHPQTP